MKKDFVVWTAICVIVFMCLFPPWITIADYQGSRLVRREGYHCILNYPKPRGMSMRERKSYGLPYTRDWDRFEIKHPLVYLPRLAIQCAIVAFIAGGLLYTFRIKEKYRYKGQNNHAKRRRVNLKRGFRRITHVLAIFGGCVGFFVGFVLAEELGVVNWGLDSDMNHVKGLLLASVGVPVCYCAVWVIYKLIQWLVLLVMWVVYKPIRWIVLGFCDNNRLQSEKT